jgi:Zn-dependent peptidase ImmA (M78 family)
MAKVNVLRKGFKSEAERKAEFYRAELKLSKFAPLDAFKLAEHLDVLVAGISEVLPASEIKKLNKSSSQDKFSALLMKNVDNDPLIIHNDSDSKFRQQSNIMHELAHFICGHEIPEEIINLNLPGNLRYFNQVHEEEAKYLGSCLQITKVGLLWKTKHRHTLEEISEYYCASIDMVRFRLNASGVLAIRNQQRGKI